MEQGRPADFFFYELNILNLSKELSKEERCVRFLELISKKYQYELIDKNNLRGDIQGANLIWARAKFDYKFGEKIPVNQWVRLTVEIFTKLKEPL